MTAHRAPVEIRFEDGVMVVRLSGELDISTVPVVTSLVEPALGQEQAKVLIDLADLEFMDSSGLALLLALAKRVREVELLHPSAVIRRVIDATGLSDTLRIVG
jgi:anti-sigma B factor antagonist